jgi:Protein of unknown function (DUF1488)
MGFQAMKITFNRQIRSYNRDRRTVVFIGLVDNRSVICAVSEEALKDLVASRDDLGPDDYLAIFDKHHGVVFEAATRKFEPSRVEADSALLTTADLKQYAGKVGPYEKPVCAGS